MAQCWILPGTLESVHGGPAPSLGQRVLSLEPLTPVPTWKDEVHSLRRRGEQLPVASPQQLHHHTSCCPSVVPPIKVSFMLAVCLASSCWGA